MRKLITLLAIISSLSLSAQQTPQWKFWLAFEDATGTKDTVWLALDEEGTYGIDPQLGEFQQNMNEDEFHVYFGLAGGKSDTRVFPISTQPGGRVYALNQVYPVTLSWDTTLFNAPILMNSEEGPINNPLMDSEYFFNYHPGFPSYHMLFEESVEMPELSWGSLDHHFPVDLYFFRGFGDPLNTSEKMREKLSIYPNPATDQIQVSGREGIRRVSIFSLSGKLMMQEVITENRPINVSHLNEGAYIVQVETEEGVAISKFVKANN